MDQETHSFHHSFSLTLPRPVVRPWAKCLSLPMCIWHGQGVPSSCDSHSIHMQFNSTVASTDFQENRGWGLQTSAWTSTWPPGWTLDSMEAFHVVGSLPMETAYLSMGVLISSGQQWENPSLPKTGELLVNQAAACPTVKPNLQKECWSPL